MTTIEIVGWLAVVSAFFCLSGFFGWLKGRLEARCPGCRLDEARAREESSP